MEQPASQVATGGGDGVIGRLKDLGSSSHLALVGATASGKSALAMALAAACPRTEIVSVDSMAVYREMDVATAKPSFDQRRQVRHHMVDVADPAEEYGVARFQLEAREALADIDRRGGRAVLVGGTGLYLRALIDRLELPGQWPALSADLEHRADLDGGVQKLYQQLRLVDPVAARRIEPSNRRRVVRALEVTLGAGRPFSSFGPGLTRYPPTPVTLVGLAVDRDELDRRIAERLARWMDDGLLGEVRRLSARPAGLSRTARQAAGYRELLRHVEEGAALGAAVEAAAARTRSLARRQLAWFRRDPRVRWVPTGTGAVADLVEEWRAAGAGGVKCRAAPAVPPYPTDVLSAVGP